jgi:hypothetical protein
MIVVIGVMLVTSLLLVAAFTAANGEVHLTNTDRAQKKAYYAAEAGIENYEYHLTQDGNYLSYCTEPPVSNPALNQFNAGPLKKASVGVSSGEEYAIQLLPAESAPTTDRKCDKNNIVETMLEEKGSATGTFRIESTGYAEGEERSMVATFRNANFVSYVWYTKYETFDPVKYGTPIRTQCEHFYGVRPESESECQNNFFISSESVKGPMHTEDHVGICGSPIFGRTSNDRIEFGSRGFEGDEGYSNEKLSCGSPKPDFKGTHILPGEVKSLEPPPGDEELLHIVEPAYEYSEKTEVALEGNTMTVTTHKGSHPTAIEEAEGKKKEEIKSGVAFPATGVIYVTGSCSTLYSPFGPKPGYTEDSSCGNVYVHGEYTSSLTIAAQNDIIINGNLLTSPRSGETPTSNAMLGLIANNFVRVYHPVVKTYEGHGPELEAAAHKETIKVEAKTSALAKELEVEVKEVGSEFEVIIYKAKVKQETTGLLKEASKLLEITSSPNVTYSKGAKYAEGEAEKLKTLKPKGLNETCNKVDSDKYSSSLKACEYTDSSSACDAPNASVSEGELNEPTIYAAILALKHAFVVDNYSCGTPTLGHLNVYGAIAGLFSNGLTGQFSGTSIVNGYPYNANYDNRLQIEEPPHFLNPVQAAWYIQRQTIAPNP